MPGSKEHPLMDNARDVASSIIICAVIAALITALIGGGLFMIGDNEFEFNLSVFGITYIVLFIARYAFPNLFELIFSNLNLMWHVFD